MVEISIQDDSLLIEVQGWHQLWAFKKSLEIPLSHVRGVKIDPEHSRYPEGWRAPGSFVPGLIAAGSYHWAGKHFFWDVHDPKKAITLDLEDEHYSKLVLEVADPQAAVQMIETALAAR